MKPKKQTLTAAGASAWVPVDYRGSQFGIGIGAQCSNDWNGTYSIQHTFDDPYNTIDCTISRTTTTASITFPSEHGLVVGDSVTVTGIREDNLSGTFPVAAITSATVCTYTVSDTGSAAENAKVTPMKVFEHDTLTAKTATADGGYDLPPACIRANVTTFTAGDLIVNYRFLS